MVWSRGRGEGGEDGKEREGGQRVDQNVGQKDIKRDRGKEEEEEEEEVTTTHSPSPFLESERESKREEERETESSFFSFSFFSVVSIVESQIDLKGRPPSQRIPSS